MWFVKVVSCFPKTFDFTYVILVISTLRQRVILIITVQMMFNLKKSVIFYLLAYDVFNNLFVHVSGVGFCGFIYFYANRFLVILNCAWLPDCSSSYKLANT